MMRSYLVDDLRVGMVIAEELLLFDGLIVIKSGIELEESIIEVLKKQNVESVLIQVSADNNKIYTLEEIESMKTEIEAHKKLLFRDCHDDEYLNALLRAVCDLRLLESMDG